MIAIGELSEEQIAMLHENFDRLCPKLVREANELI